MQFETDESLLDEARRTLPKFGLWIPGGPLDGAVDDSGFLERNASSLSYLIVEAGESVEDSRERAEVQRVLYKALTNETFFKIFAGTVVKLGTSAAGKMRSVCLLKWSVALLGRLKLPDSKKAISKLLEVAGQCLDNLGRHKSSKLERPLSKMVSQDESLRLEAFSVAEQSHSAGLLRIVCAGVKEGEELRETILKDYCSSILSAKAKPDEERVYAYKKLLAGCTKSEFEGILIPGLTRAMRRNPEIVVDLVVSLLGAVSLDLSSFGVELLNVLLQFVRHANQSVQASSLTAVESMSRLISDKEVLKQMIEKTENLLSGNSEGKIKNVAERIAVAKVFNCLAMSPTKRADVSSVAIAALCGLSSTEGNDEAKAEMLRSAGPWLKALSSIDDQLLKILAGALNGKEVLRSGALFCLYACKDSPSVLANGDSLAPFLCKIVEGGLQKQSSRSEGILGLWALAAISASNPESDDMADKAGIWQKALEAASPFFDPAVFSKLPSDTCQVLVSLCQQLLIAHVSRVDSIAGCLGRIARALVLLSMHRDKEVRHAAWSSVPRCLGSSSLLLDFLEGFKYWQRHALGTPIFKVRLLLTYGHGPEWRQGDGEGEGNVDTSTVKIRFFESLSHLLPFGIDSDATVLSKLLLISHHPLMHSLRDVSFTWKSLYNTHKDIKATFEGAVGEVMDILVSENGILSEDPEEREAALLTVLTTAKDFPVQVFERLVPFASRHLDRSEYDQLTESDIRIFNTPEGKLSSEMDSGIVIVANPKKKQRKKKEKGRFRHEKVAFAEQTESSSEEEEPLKPDVHSSKHPTKSKKTGHLDASERQQAFRAKQLAEETEVRNKVRGIQSKFDIGLKTLAACIQGNPSNASGLLEELAAIILPFLTNELVGEGSAFLAAIALATALPPPLCLVPLDVAVILRLVMLLEESGDGSHERLVSHKSMESVMHSIDKLNPEGGQVLYVLLPILRVATKSPQSPFFDSAMNFLVSNCVPGEKLPRQEIFSLLFDNLSKNTAIKEAVSAAISNLCIDMIGDEIFSILDGVLFAEPVVRSAAIDALYKVPALTNGIPLDNSEITALLVLAANDVDEDNRSKARRLLQESRNQVRPDHVDELAPLVGHEILDIRQAAVNALVECLQSHPIKTQYLLSFTMDTIKDGCTKEWLLGGALMFETCAKLFASKQIEESIDFILSHGLRHPDDSIREKMVSAGMSLVDSYNPRDIGDLFDLLDRRLGEAKVDSRDPEADDRMREGAVVLLGSMAKHLLAEDPKIKGIIENLIDVLSTPSEAVQKSASTCLSPLISKCQSDTDYVTQIVDKLKSQLKDGSTYGHRRGAAYGIAGVVKGCGIAALKNYQIMDTLIGYVDDKTSATAREGAVSAFDCLSQRLGKLFEPYVIRILPLLLNCYSDTTASVRQATSEASRTIMYNLSAQGVKLVLPSLMAGLDNKAWRTKQGSIQLLGAMAWCAPKQLSSCLPTIVPQLITVLADPHPKVHNAAELALQEVGSTIRNPEVSQLVPDILTAIAHPSKNTVSCLNKLMEAKFVNTIDASSLALIVPVVHYGLKDRAGENKKRAARIVQNLCKLVNDPKDMDPYISLLLPELKKGIVDTLPDVRAQAAKALSGLMYDMGKQALEEVMPWLLEVLESKGSSVVRSGAAQAISEVMAVFGEEYFESLLPKILQNCSSPSAVTREGGVAVLRYLPYSMPDLFREKLGIALPCILDGLADENEAVRDISLAAGRTLVDVYAETSLPVILPAVEQSLFNENWRIRHSSANLLGNLIFKVAGTSGKVKLDGGSDDEGPATSSYGRNLVKALGLEQRNSVLAKLYMARSDVAQPVRTEALHIWKTVVVNTPKTLMEILNALTALIIEMLAVRSEDSRQTSARCLGELVRKMGDRFLPKIIPIVTNCFESDNVDTREGVCYGLREILDSLSTAQLAEYIPVLLPTIQSTLCDEDPTVREAAAVAFDALFKSGASSVVDSVIPDLLQKLEQEKHSDKALEGLRVILSIRPHTFENMLPKLMREPISARRLRAIASMAEVAPGALRKHLTGLLRTLMKLANQTTKADISAAARSASKQIVLVVPEEHLGQLVSELKKGLDDSALRLASALLVETLAASRQIENHLDSLLQTLVSLMSEDNPEVLKACWTAMKTVAAVVPKEMHLSYLRVVSEGLETAEQRERRKDPSRDTVVVPGFCLPDGIGPLLPFYTEGLQSSSGETREAAANGLGALISVMDSESLKPFVGLIMGPLIRIINDRFPWQVKLAILKTMGLLISKSGEEMRKFAAALQPIFLRYLPDPTDSIRNTAAKNLGLLTRLTPRIDPLINNLANFASKMEPPMRSAYLSALAEAFAISGDKISADLLVRVGTGLTTLINKADSDEEEVIAMGTCLGAYCKISDIGFVSELLTKRLEETILSANQRFLNAVLMAAIAKQCPERLVEAEVFNLFCRCLTKGSRDDSVPIKMASCRTAGRLLLSECRQQAVNVSSGILVACLDPDQPTEIKEEALKFVQLVCVEDRELLSSCLQDLVPLICALTRESLASMKTSCETALSLILNLSDGFDTANEFLSGKPGSAAKSLLTESYLRRIQKYTKPTEQEPETY